MGILLLKHFLHQNLKFNRVNFKIKTTWLVRQIQINKSIKDHNKEKENKIIF